MHDVYTRTVINILINIHSYSRDRAERKVLECFHRITDKYPDVTLAEVARMIAEEDDF